MMKTRVRFAPSPTGHVHIGNIRTAIFNWLFARNENGSFLLRIEDTDKERSTKEAIDTLLECMKWLNLDFDEEPVYQSSCSQTHLEVADKLLDNGLAYQPKLKEGEQKAPLIFRIPWDTKTCPSIREVGPAELKVHPEVPVKISKNGISYALISKKGKPMPESASLSGFRQLKIYDPTDQLVFDLEETIDSILENLVDFSFENCHKFSFLKREVFFNDLIKGELSKPLESVKDLVIVRSNGSPVFHLANVCDDMKQQITHIIRGDDHVENTFRHILLFNALGAPPPLYGHLPMIVNQQGKPYSKRDGDAFVGDFKKKGFLPEALLNYLTLLGWSPGDDREKMSIETIVQLFTLDRIKSAPAQFDIKKLMNLNYMYLSEKAPEEFVELAWEEARKYQWIDSVDKEYFKRVAHLMQSRTKLITQVEEWKYFFADQFDYDIKAVRKFLDNENTRTAIDVLLKELDKITEFNEENIEKAIHISEHTSGIPEGKLNQPLRIALTGRTTGAGIYETMAVLGKERCTERLSNIPSTKDV